MSNITRTYFNTIVSVKLFDNSTDEIVIRTANIDGKIALNDVKKTLEKYGVFSNATILKITDVSYEETLYSMTESDFIHYGKAVAERSKDTRYSVTKEIIGFNAHCTAVIDDDMTIGELDIMLPRKMDNATAKRFLNKNNPGYTVVKCDVTPVNNLYAMPIGVFKELAEKLPPRVKTENK